jgi:putative FmdB family regulatory protein
MPLYEYQCLDCGSRDERLAGLDDHTAVCLQCRGLMLRQDEDLFGRYFDEDDSRVRPDAAALSLS